MPAIDWQDWFAWLSTIPSAMWDIIKGLMAAPLLLDADQHARWLNLQPRLRTLLRGISPELASSNVNVQMAYNNLAIRIRLAPEGTLDDQLLQEAIGNDKGRPEFTRMLENNELLRELWDKSEAARNGSGGGAPVRRG